MNFLDKLSSNNIARYLAAAILLVAPLVAYPLVWGKLIDNFVPLWGDVECLSLREIAILAIAFIILFPERIINALKEKSHQYYFFITSIIVIGLIFLQQLLYGGAVDFINLGLFYVTVPAAGFALSFEIKKLAKYYFALLFIILIVFSFTGDSKFLTGFVGNWNWNLSLIAVAIPSVFLLFKWSAKVYYLISSLSILGFLILVYYWNASIMPKGAIAGVVGAILGIVIISIIKLNKRHLACIFMFAALAVGFISFLLSTQGANAKDTRVQLWQGALSSSLSYSYIGHGPGRFESKVKPFIPEEYYFTEFVADRHPHPHNEFLYYLSSFGIIGIVLLYLLISNALYSCNIKHKNQTWMLFVALTFIIHGQFDILLATPLAGTIFLLFAGALANNKNKGEPTPYISVRYVLALMAISFTIYLASLTYNSTKYLRLGRLNLHNNQKAAAKVNFIKSLTYKLNSPALYSAGSIELFDYKNPIKAIEYFDKIHNNLKLDSYVHSRSFAARAKFVTGQYKAALLDFEMEEKNYPLSALNSGFIFMAKKALNFEPAELATSYKKFEYLMALRGLKVSDFSKLQRNPRLDDMALSQVKEQK
jgi:O-antigen ligase